MKRPTRGSGGIILNCSIRKSSGIKGIEGNAKEGARSIGELKVNGLNYRPAETSSAIAEYAFLLRWKSPQSGDATIETADIMQLY